MSPTATKKKNDKDGQEKELSEEERIDRLEAAVGSLGVKLPEYDSDEVVRARAQVALDAEEAARKAADEAVKKIKPLTVEERLERLESLAQTGLGVSFDDPAGEPEEEPAEE